MLCFSDGSGSCPDKEQPHHRGWSGRGPRASGRVQDLGRPDGQLPGFTDSEAESSRNPRGMDADDGGAADHQEPAEPDQAPADARAPSPRQVYTKHAIHTIHALIETDTHRIHTDTYMIHTYTCRYRHIQAKPKARICVKRLYRIVFMLLRVYILE
jgi:hypothetical protein